MALYGVMRRYVASCTVIWRYVELSGVFLAEYDVIWRYETSCDVLWGYVALFSVM